MRISRARGFTLIEVLSAIMLIGIVLPVAMQGISLATALAGSAERKAEASMLADSKLNELVVTRGWQNGELNGDFGQDHPDFQWAVELRQWDSSTLQEMDLHVFWTAGGRQQSITLSTLVDS